mmetsp:Transcript_13501/g.18508  ORF Transcript_13501/g.18508 Transcript_13501/m.18508 type:complete len:343 (+) Transcript_13501:160-1188(+)|eukprot:CAMPEP_0196582892 /NCGR_PEP_ID=MMETSP1081-20130531/41189_1 /TAXON_ID=36882 /ORGANISM="Pyramimonas amylifera, Strain CCMP720" /LENGTH=342 /DNA_ID=CAMNT_0041903613 /DNA_START=156 /DNA_END=1187 /DNA_ORIENTATION=+
MAKPKGEPIAKFLEPYNDAKGHMKEDFEWSEKVEPHVIRRKEILSKHPEIRNLFGPDISILYQVCFVVAMQTTIAYYMGVKDASWWFLLVVSYCIGGFANHHLFLAVHELSHCLAFDSPIKNRLLGFVANFPCVFPFAVSFQKYHLEHHQNQGHDGVDMDIPSYLEAKYVTNMFMKFCWVTCQLFFYALRPLIVNPKPPGMAEFLNLLSCIAYDATLYHFGGHKAIVYMIASTFLGGGMHPIAGHFISEHYTFSEGQETFSYYGPLNWVVYNCGYHNEHHDFPRIPGSRLKQVYKLAPEFYENLAFHTSWSGCIWRYITDPNIGPFNRVRRNKGGAATKKSK